MTFNWTTATANTNTLWYRSEFTRLPYEAQVDGTLSDLSTSLKFNYGLTEGVELFSAFGLINKRHTLPDGSVYINNTEPTYLTLGTKAALPNFFDLSTNAYVKFDYAFNIDREFFFTSGNDRSHHVTVGFENTYALPFSTFLFMDNSGRYRTQQSLQYEGTWGAGWSNGTYTVSGFYHLLTSQDTDYDCFHAPSDEEQFHYLPLFKANSSNPVTRGPGWDAHQGPGASVSMAFRQGETNYMTVELFTYIKTAGVNTDRSATIGANLSYALY